MKWAKVKFKLLLVYLQRSCLKNTPLFFLKACMRTWVQTRTNNNLKLIRNIMFFPLNLNGYMLIYAAFTRITTAFLGNTTIVNTNIILKTNILLSLNRNNMSATVSLRVRWCHRITQTTSNIWHWDHLFTNGLFINSTDLHAHIKRDTPATDPYSNHRSPLHIFMAWSQASFSFYQLQYLYMKDFMAMLVLKP